MISLPEDDPDVQQVVSLPCEICDQRMTRRLHHSHIQSAVEIEIALFPHFVVKSGTFRTVSSSAVTLTEHFPWVRHETI